MVASYFCPREICRSKPHEARDDNQAPGKPDPTRSIAHNLGYIRRSRPHEGGGDTRGNMRRIKNHRVGEVSSKYGYNPKWFEKDLEARKARSDALWADFLEWMKLHGITPDEARGLFRRMFEEYLK